MLESLCECTPDVLTELCSEISLVVMFVIIALACRSFTPLHSSSYPQRMLTLIDPREVCRSVQVLDRSMSDQMLSTDCAIRMLYITCHSCLGSALSHNCEPSGIEWYPQDPDLGLSVQLQAFHTGDWSHPLKVLLITVSIYMCKTQHQILPTGKSTGDRC